LSGWYPYINLLISPWFLNQNHMAIALLDSLDKDLSFIHQQFPSICGNWYIIFKSIKKYQTSGQFWKSLYEQFSMVVHLKEHVCITDSMWQDVLNHVWHGNCWQSHIETLQSVTMLNPECPCTDFSVPQWDSAVLITPWHSVLRHWNEEMSMKWLKENKMQLFICMVSVFQGCTLTVGKHYEMARKHPRQ